MTTIVSAPQDNHQVKNILYFDLMMALWGWNNCSHIIFFLINKVVLDSSLYIHIWYQHNGMDSENSTQFR
jgi:hypothetical protein